jgi:prepilin signal peptidase PulO-like enzyme (type II secretory pathway)
MISLGREPIANSQELAMIFVREIVFLALLGALLASDWKRGRLPYWISYLGMALAILSTVYFIRTEDFAWSHSGLGIVAGYLVSGLLALVPGLMKGLSGDRPEKDKLLGEDYALIAMVGAFTGPLGIILAFVLALVLARLLPVFKLTAPFSFSLVVVTLLLRYIGTPIMGHWFGL